MNGIKIKTFKTGNVPKASKQMQKRQATFQAGRFLKLQKRDPRHLAKVIDHLSVLSSNHSEKGFYGGVRDMTVQLPPTYAYYMHVSSKHVYGMTNRKRRNTTRLNRHYPLNLPLAHPILKEKARYYPDYNDDLMVGLWYSSQAKLRQRIAFTR